MKSKIVILIIIVFVLFFLPQILFIVDQTESAIVIQLGKPMRTIMEPGLHFKTPFIQEVIFFDNRLLDYDALPKDIITKDKKTLVVDNYAKWRIKDPLKVYQSVRDERGAQTRLDDIIYSELRVDLGVHNLIEIVSKQRSSIMKTVTQRSSEKASAFGIEITDVRIKRADLPLENENAVYARMETERQREAKRYRSEGGEESQKIKSLADKEKAIILAEAYRESQELMGRGDAEAFKKYAAAYKKDPSFFEFMRTMDAYKETFTPGTTLVLTPDSEYLKYLKRD
ncbi:MAG: protease modulator HflC [Nitrospirota bacterium]